MIRKIVEKKPIPTQEEIRGRRRHSQPNSTVSRVIPIIVRPHHIPTPPVLHATAQAIDAVRGLVVDGPVQLVTDEIARLATEVERAEQLAERWEQTATRFDAQRATHKAKDDEHADVLRRAEADLRVIDVAQQVEAARGDRDAMRERREQEQRQQALAEREWQLSEPTEADRRHDPQRDGPARGL